MADVAARAGVGTITVSRALRTPQQVSAEVRERVRAAIEATGYVPNLAAGTLVEPFDAPVDVDAQGHYLCYAPERLDTSDALRRFRDWMLDESGRA